jgi:hypothetical protein
MIPIHVFRPKTELPGKPIIGRSSPLPSIVGVHWSWVATILVFGFLLADKLFCMAVGRAGILLGWRQVPRNAVTVRQQPAVYPLADPVAK